MSKPQNINYTSKSRNGFDANTDRLTKSWEYLEMRKFIMYAYKFGWYNVIVSMFSSARQVHFDTGGSPIRYTYAILRTNIRFILSKVPWCFKSLNGEIGKDATYACIVAFPIWIKTKENSPLLVACVQTSPLSQKKSGEERREESLLPIFSEEGGDVCTQAILLVVLETNQKALLIIS